MDELGLNFYAPTVITGVNSSMRLLREETFGPVLPIIPFDTDEEAIRLANDSDFGLAASVFTGNTERGENIARKLKVGTVMVNDVITGFGISEAPHGGMKASGLGRSHGKAGLQEMVQLKYVDSDRLAGMPKLWWFGYGNGFREQMAGYADFLFSSSFGQRIRGLLKSTGAIFRKGRI